MKCHMNNNISAFFELVRAGLWESNASLQEYGNVDYRVIYKLAEEQSVMGLVTAGMEHVIDNKIPKDIALEFIGKTLQIEQQNKSMNAFLAELINELRNQGVYTILVKGQGVGRCYERPLWRACGDIDLFLSDENYSKAKSVLIPQASSIEKESVTSKHQGLIIGDWVVELHGTLYSSLSSRIYKGLREIQDDTFFCGNVRSWSNGGVLVFLLAADNDIVYTFTHFLGHFYKGGIGIRQICDWCRLLWTYRDSINHTILENRLRAMGLKSEWRAFGAFAVEYLGMPKDAFPLYSPDLKWKKKASRICSFIMEVGNFGHNRDLSYFSKYPYLLKKLCSFGVRMHDLFRHALIFPIDSLRFFPNIVINGLRSAAKGE